MAKTLSPSFVTFLHEVCADADGYSIRSYSGRFMYGKDCFAIQSEQGGSPSEFWALCVEKLVPARYADDSDINDLRDNMSDLSKLMHKIREDSMALGRVFYNPNIAWREEYDPDYEETSEDDESDEEGDGSDNEGNASEMTLEPAT